MTNELVSARLQVIAAKAKILSEKYKSGALWSGELDKALREIETELTLIRRESGDSARDHYDR